MVLLGVFSAAVGPILRSSLVILGTLSALVMVRARFDEARPVLQLVLQYAPLGAGRLRPARGEW